jgi:endoribonuclease Dicer
MTIYDSFANNHPTTLLHHTLSQAYGCSAYQLLCETVDSNVTGGKAQAMAGLVIHMHGEMVGAVVRESGRYAREAASKKALGELQGLTVREFRNKFGCDCVVMDVVNVETDVKAKANGVATEQTDGVKGVPQLGKVTGETGEENGDFVFVDMETKSKAQITTTAFKSLLDA